MKRLHTIVTVALLLLLALLSSCRAEEWLLVYEELVTGGADPGTPLPMLVAVHGLGDSPEGFGSLFTGWRDVQVRVILPQGPDAHGRGWSWFETRIRGGDVVKIDLDDIRSSAERIVRLTEHVVATRPTVGKPIITGFSQGGVMSFVVAVTHPDLVAASIPMGGWLPEELRPSREAHPSAPPLRALHGEADTLVPYSRTKMVVEALAAQGWDAALTGYAGQRHTIGRDMRGDLKKYFIEYAEKPTEEKVKWYVRPSSQ